MRHLPLMLRLPLALLVCDGTVSTAAAASGSPFQTGFARWRAAAGGFAGWTLAGARRTSAGALALDPGTATPGSEPNPAGDYHGGYFYNGGSFFVGEATGPELPAPFSFAEAIVSWNANTPAGAWIETQLRVRLGDRWSKWYNMGVWASGTEAVARHSVPAQGDADGYVAVDTFVLAAKKTAVTAYQVKVRLFSADGLSTPTVRNVSVAYSTAAPKKTKEPPNTPGLLNTVVDVPGCSQMAYPDGGNVWCSPTSTSMILGRWGFMPGPCEPRVRAAVAGVYDRVYDGHGNWPFNTAYAASLGYEGYVARFTSLAQLEPWIAADVPVAMSIAWGKGDLTGAPIPSSSGHLMVLVGFDEYGNPMVNDPAAAANEAVRRTYLRAEFEALWLSSSGGATYLICPVGWPVPALPGMATM